MRNLLALLIALCGLVHAAQAQNQGREYTLGAGDVVKITVFQNPDLTTESRVTETGAITFPLVGSVPVGGLTIPAAEQKLAGMLREGGFVLQPQVNMLVLKIAGSQVAVLGQVNRPGRYPLETLNSRVSDILALAGGITQIGSDTVILTGIRDGKPVRMEIDVPAMFLDARGEKDIIVHPGDALYVHRAPTFYIYGEVQRPGAYRIERDMTVMQALAQGGGPTLRGTERGLRIHRRNAEGRIEEIRPEMTDRIQNDDVLYVRESLF
ncbi:MAG: polysaccharide export protein EpsE [Caenispirillum sp.]|nr:polysaccharide export protein EpsE [Caenispirillum sp.]